MARRRHRTVSIVLAAVGGILVLAATVLGYLEDRIFDSDAFAAFVSEALDEPEVRNYLADEIADEILLVAPDAAAGGTAIRDLTATLLEAEFTRGIVESSARDLHQTIFDDGADSILLLISDIVVTVRSQLQLIDPDLAALIPEQIDTMSVEMGSGDFFTDAVRLADSVGGLASASAVAAVLCLIGAVWFDDNRWRGAGNAGLAIAVAGGLTLVTVTVGGSVVESYTDELAAGDAIEAAWTVFVADLTPWAWTLIIVGSLICAIAWSLLRFGAVLTPVERIRRFLLERPEGLPAQVVRALVGIVLAIWLIREPLTLIAIAGALGGIALGIVSVRELLRVTGLEARMGAMLERDAATEAPTRGTVVVLGIGITVTLIVLASVAARVLSRDEPAEAMVDGVGCNGHVELCPRRLDQVALAATHNSMSASADGFLLANQTRGILPQLDAGYRGLLIDLWYGTPTASGPVLTTNPSADGMDAETEAAAERVRARLTGEAGEVGLYLCHGFCEIGAIEAIDALAGIRQWLLDHPREVIVVFVQDMTEPEDTARAFEESGLADLAYDHVWGTPLPTLDEMITDDRRVFVMAEEDAGAIPWLHDGFSYTQETPFSFAGADEFSCEPNRGREDSPLFQVNHFITPALGRNGSINDPEVLVPRLEQCREERGLLPNLVAVDFWEAGDTVAAVDLLNGVG